MTTDLIWVERAYNRGPQLFLRYVKLWLGTNPNRAPIFIRDTFVFVTRASGKLTSGKWRFSRLSNWTSTSMQKHFIQKCSFKSPKTWKRYIRIFSHENVYWWWMRPVAASNFWLHFLTTLIPTIFCPYFAHIGLQPTFTPPPTLCSIPLTCSHWIKNPSKASVGVDTKFCNKISFSWFQAFAVFYMLYTFFWVYPASGVYMPTFQNTMSFPSS